MEIAPFVDAFACKIADSRCCGNKCGKPKVKVRQQSKIDDKADAWRHQIRQSRPDGFGCLWVAGAGSTCLFSEGKKIRVQKVRIGCFGIFAGNAEIDSLAPNGDSSEQRIRINIGPKPGKQHEHQGKCRNCENNTAEGCGKLDFVQNCRCNKQFGNAFARAEQCKHDAERENTLCVLSGCAQHESRVLPKIVLRFRCFFCAGFGLSFFFCSFVHCINRLSAFWCLHYSRNSFELHI